MDRKRIGIIAFGTIVMLLVTALPIGPGGREEWKASQTTMLTDKKAGGAKASGTVTHTTVHDPSIVKDPQTGRYYIFGSHMAWAYSDDLQNWTQFRNNINRDFSKLFEKAFAWARMGDPVYRENGNLWAPDVIWNPTMKKWCMYMSINGCSWNSSIVLLTSDSLEGDWSYEGIVVYSGMTAASGSHDFRKTDYTKATGESTLALRYIGGRYTCMDGGTRTAETTWNTTYGAHAIDPCVFYDSEGNLFMSYGSWSGGIYLLRLDSATGLRDYSVKYALEANVSDPYMGRKISGGSFVSGEASYIQKIGAYYYLFVTYGGLEEKGGYNMRVFRSKDPAGPYLDASGSDARATGGGNNINGTVGNRLMSYYGWSFMEKGYVAQGHNSVLLDDDGRIYVVYHTRFTNRNEYHEVRVHQLFVNESGWLVAAPFEYSGEKLAKVSKKDVAGSYEVLFHRGTDYIGKKCVAGIALKFTANGKITGEKKGTWKFSSKGAPYVTVKIGKNTYEGVFVKQKLEPDNATNASIGNAYKHGASVMTFTLLGKKDELSVWGYNNTKTFGRTKAPAVTLKNLKNGVEITWNRMSGASGYRVFRKVGSGKWKKIKTIGKAGATVFVDKKAPEGKLASYRIRGFTATKLKSAYSPAEKNLFVKPMSISKAAAQGDSMKVEWAKQEKASGYYVQYSLSPLFTFSNQFVMIGSGSQTSVTIKGLEKGKTYYVRMQQRRKAKKQSYSGDWGRSWKVSIG